jgi:hypothetical protein
MEKSNYDQDKQSLIDKNEFLPDDLSELDPSFMTDVCESLEDHWLIGLSSESYIITPLIHNNKLNTKEIVRSTLIGHKRAWIDLQSVKNTDLAPILYLRTGLEYPNPRRVKIL